MNWNLWACKQYFIRLFNNELTVTCHRKLMSPGPRVPVHYNQPCMTYIILGVISLILATNILKIDTKDNVALQIL